MFDNIKEDLDMVLQPTRLLLDNVISLMNL